MLRVGEIVSSERGDKSPSDHYPSAKDLGISFKTTFLILRGMTCRYVCDVGVRFIAPGLVDRMDRIIGGRNELRPLYKRWAFCEAVFVRL